MTYTVFFQLENSSTSLSTEVDTIKGLYLDLSQRAPLKYLKSNRQLGSCLCGLALQQQDSRRVVGELQAADYQQVCLFATLHWFMLLQVITGNSLSSDQGSFRATHTHNHPLLKALLMICAHTPSQPLCSVWALILSSLDLLRHISLKCGIRLINSSRSWDIFKMTLILNDRNIAQRDKSKCVLWIERTLGVLSVIPKISLDAWAD